MEDRTGKEDYVRTQILNQAYSSEEFSSFLTEQKGTDLSQYTFEELQGLVEAFQASHISRNNVELSAETLKCRELPASPLTGQAIQVHVTLGDSFRATFRTHQLYTVLTSPLDWSVQRKYSDFLWLRNKLQQTFPHHLVPALPPLKDKLEDRKSPTKVKFLNFFVSYLATAAPLNSHPWVLAFLRETNPAEFKYIRKQARYERRPRKVHELSSADGEVQSHYEDFSDYYAVYLRRLNSYEDQLKVLSRQAKAVVDKSDELHLALTSFLLQAEKLATFDWEQPELTAHSSAYCRTLSETFSVVAQSQKKAGVLMKEYVSDTLEFAAAQVYPLKAQLKSAQALRSQFLKALRHKETREEMQKLVKDTKLEQLEQAKQRYGVLNYSLRTHLDKVNEHWLAALTQNAQECLQCYADSQHLTASELAQVQQKLREVNPQPS